MRKILMMVSLAACLFGHASSRAEETYVSRRVTSPDDSKAILQIVTKFEDAIKTKDTKALSTLVLNDNILFTAVMDGKKKQEINESSDVNFDGVRYGGYSRFAQLLASIKETVEEKFFNVNVTQDGPVAWVIMDYQTLRAGTVSNHGLETWQMFKPDGKTWKILSVVWSSYDGA
jgi:ketosteroid isomerase-like protein